MNFIGGIVCFFIDFGFDELLKLLCWICVVLSYV